MNYYNIYISLVIKAKKENKSKTEYYEKHHIKPRSMGGTNCPSNLVKLTPRQHFIAHRLLEKFTRGTEYHHKMLIALKLMSSTKSNGAKGVTSTSRTYETIRVLCAIHYKTRHGSVLYKNNSFSLTGIDSFYEWVKVSNILSLEKFLPRKFLTGKAVKQLLSICYGVWGLGYKSVRGITKFRFIIKDLIDIGLFEFREKCYYFSNKLIDIFESSNISPPTRVIKDFMISDPSIKSRRGVGIEKEKINKYNDENPSDLHKLIYLENSFHWKKY